MIRTLSMALVLVLAASSVASARNGSHWRGHGNRGFSTGESTFFLEEKKQAQIWYCGPGPIPTQACVRR